MSYTISEVAKMLNVSAYTIRYYDKEGLFPLVKRVNGIRVFEDEDFPWLRMLNCLKNINMPIKKIKEYVDLALKGDETLKERYDLILEQEENIQNQIKQLKYYKKQIDFKKAYYEKAMELGSEAAVQDWINKKPTLDVDEVPEEATRAKNDILRMINSLKNISAVRWLVFNNYQMTGTPLMKCQ